MKDLNCKLNPKKQPDLKTHAKINATSVIQNNNQANKQKTGSNSDYLPKHKHVNPQYKASAIAHIRCTP